MEKNKKSKLILLIGLLILLLVLLYFFVFKTAKPKILDLKIVTYSSLCDKTKMSMDGNVSPFFRIYEGDDCIYYPDIKIKRNDHGGQSEGFEFTSEIGVKTKESEAEKIFKDAADEKMPSLACKDHGTDSISIEKDTTKVRHFFLVGRNDARVDGKLYFDDAQKLAVYIDKLGAKGELFTEEQKPDAIHVIILPGGSGNSQGKVHTETTTDIVVNPNDESRVREPDEPNVKVIEEVERGPDIPAASINSIDVSHSGAINTIAWEASNADGATYTVSISCHEGCYDDGSDYSLTESNIRGNSIEMNLQNEWNGIKQRTFQVTVQTVVGGKAVRSTKSNVKLYCK